MVVPDYNYRISANRAIYVVGEFNDALMQLTIPRITELRCENNKPISIIISSHGGNVDCLEAIVSALSVYDPDGNESRVISSVHGHAASCGAILLSSADYAIASATSIIHFHGIRTSQYDITTESAAQLANYLSKENKSIANNMAKAMMPRVMHRFLRLKKKINKKKKGLKDVYPWVLGFTDLIKDQTSPGAGKIFLRAINRLIRVRLISSTFCKVKYGPRDTILQKDAKLLQHIIQYEIKNKSIRDLKLDEEGVGQIFSDYLTIRDFHIGEHTYFLDNFIEFWGPEFLNEKKLDHYNNLKTTSEKNASNFLKNEVYLNVQDFWYLTVSIARSLLTGENKLTAYDAYWLGAIDEITGDPDAYGVRAMIEKNA